MTSSQIPGSQSWYACLHSSSDPATQLSLRLRHCSTAHCIDICSTAVRALDIVTCLLTRDNITRDPKLTQSAQSAGHHHVPSLLWPQGQRVDKDEVTHLDHGLWLASQPCHGPLVGLAHSPEAALQAGPLSRPETEGCHNPKRVKYREI